MDKDVYTLIVRKFSLGQDEFGNNIYIYRPLELQIGFISEGVFYNDNGREYTSIEDISFINKEYDEGYFLELTKEEIEKKYKISDNAEIYKFYKDIIDNKMIVAIADDPEYYSLKIIEKDKLIDNEVLLFIPEFAETPLSLDKLKEIADSGDIEKLKEAISNAESDKLKEVISNEEAKKTQEKAIEKENTPKKGKESTKKEEKEEDKKKMEEEKLRKQKQKELEEVFSKAEFTITLTKKDIQDLYNYLKSRVIGQEEAIETACYTIYKNSRLKDGESKTNCIFIGPTGSGKSMIADTIGEFLKFKPLVHIDANSLSTTGYVGANVEDCLSQLIVKADGNIFRAEHGIVVIDEIDKKNTKDNGDVGGKGVINQILRFVEGQQYSVEYYLNNKKRTAIFDTTNLTVLACGAFPEVYEELINKNVGKNKPGFLSEIRSLDKIEEERKENERELEISHEDLATIGRMGPEFAGRFIIAPLHKPDKETLVRIMTESKASPLTRVIELLEEDDIIFRNDDKFVEAIAELAYNEGSGGRGIKNSIDKIFKKIIKKTVFTIDNDYISDDGKVYLFGTTNEEGKIVVNTLTGENILENKPKEKNHKVLTKKQK